MIRNSFTTFEVGDLCQVYHTTVINWINQGRLKAHKTPGKHRRIQRDDLVAFMNKFSIPIPPELSDQKKRVLAVDDDPAVLRLLHKTFSRLSSSIQLQTTSNGVEALVLVGKDVPDLIILDVIMPGMDGIEVCRTLASNKETAKTKIIVITGKDLFSTQEKFLIRNVDAILYKPFSPLALLETTCTLLGLEVATK